MSRYGKFRQQMTRELAEASSPTRKTTKPAKPPVPLEHDIQALFVQLVAQLGKPLDVSFAIPNAAKRSPMLMGRLKREGFRTGIPDWCLPVPRGPYNALWIEFKRPGGKPTPEQTEMLKRLEEEGGAVHIVDDAAKGLEVVREYLALKQRAV